jgi:hypothetical protein
MKTILLPWLRFFSSIACAATFSASAATLTMNELPFQPVNGLSFGGVTFTFTIGGIGSTDANYNGTGPGIGTWVQDPTLEGNAAGVLRLDFAVPTSGMSFGIARSVAAPLTPGVSVDLFSPSLTYLGTINQNTTVPTTFSEAQFSTGLTISRAVLSFPSSGTATRFALDNLTYSVPEPSAVGLALIGLTCLGFKARFSRARSFRV